MGFVKGTDGIARTVRNPLEGSVGDIALDDIITNTLTSTANVTGGNLITAGQISATSTITSSANVVGGNITTAGLITAGGNVTSGNLSVTGNVTGGNLNVTGNIVDTGALSIITGSNGNIALAPNGTGIVTVSSNISATGNVTANSFVGNGATLSNVATTFESAWTVPTGNSTQSFTVTPSNTYLMWVDCNIPNGILTWNATATVTNTNVPVVGAQYAWVYNGGGTPIDFTSIPDQFEGISNTIVRSNVAPSATTNRFDFGINNTSGNAVTVRYGWAQIS
jgi:hypothetical protein